MKKLTLKKDVLGDLRSDELVQVVGGTLSVRICIQTQHCLSVRICVKTLPESHCVCIYSDNDATCVC